ncbi:MAG: ABC transporter permease subunit [Acidimicrobiales bacterium]|nr:ABC transporter permease subunit [Acidimicrobiales bacterium]
MTSPSRTRIVTVARHEYRAAVRNRLLVTLAGILVAVTIASVYIASADYASQLADYNAYRDAATASGLDRIAPSPLAPLSLLRGAIEYVEIIGAVIAIAIGYLSVSQERANRTLGLLRSRPLTGGEHALGSLLGALAVFATLIAATAITAIACVGIIGNDWLGAADLLQLLLAYIAALFYMAAFYALGAIATARSRVAANGLMVALGVWLVVVLILPQIGDTLDADNQVPGGLFSALGLGHDGEVTILTHFTTYERIRTFTENLSLAKHFERFAFAMTDVKDRYRPYSLGLLLRTTWADIAWLTAAAVVLTAGLRRTFRTQPPITQGAT